MRTYGNDFFPTTRWTLVMEARNGSTIAMDELFSIYRDPLVRFVRSTIGNDWFGFTPEDVVHDFLEKFIRNNSIQSIDRNKGLLRNLFKTSLRRHLHSIREKQRAQKRAVDFCDVESDSASPPLCRQEEFYRVFDRHWAFEMLRFAFLEVEAASADKDGAGFCDTIRRHMTTSGEFPSYEVMGDDLGKSRGATQKAFSRFCERLESRIQKELCKTTTQPFLVGDEMLFLSQVLREALTKGDENETAFKWWQ